MYCNDLILFSSILIIHMYDFYYWGNNSNYILKPPPPPNASYPSDFWKGILSSDASVAKWQQGGYRRVRYAWIVHARVTYRRKICILFRARYERTSSMWMPREHCSIGELAWGCGPASYPPLPPTNIRVSDASVAKSRTPLPHTQHQGEAAHSCAIVCFVLSSHPKFVNRFLLSI